MIVRNSAPIRARPGRSQIPGPCYKVAFDKIFRRCLGLPRLLSSPHNPPEDVRKKRSLGGYTLRSMSEGVERNVPLALMVQARDEPGALHALTGVLLEHEANITHIDIAERRDGLSTVYFELEDVGEKADGLVGDLEALPI